MLLQVLQVIEAATLLHDDRELVLSLLVDEVLLAASEDVVETLEGDSEHPHVAHLEHLAESCDHTLLDEDLELRRDSTRRAVAEGPDCLVLNSHVIVLQDLNELVDDASVDALLDLLNGSSCDIREHPAGLFSHSLLWMSDDGTESLHQSVVHGHLSLAVVSSNDVADGPQTRDGDGYVFVPQERDHFLKEANMEKIVNSLFGAIRKI